MTLNRTEICMLLIILVTGIHSCTVTLNTPHESLTEGYYLAGGTDGGKVYVTWQLDTMLVYCQDPSMPEAGEVQKAEKMAIQGITTRSGVKRFPSSATDSVSKNVNLVKSSADLDFMTILFKYRPSTPSLPRQLNTDLSGAIYLGYRLDHFWLAYKTPYPGIVSREINHFGYSAGIFTGFGATAMNPWVTSDAISTEYEGVVWSGGLAGLVGISQFTLGVAIGWDFLLDNNRSSWIYQGKPWYGLTVGVNLN